MLQAEQRRGDGAGRGAGEADYADATASGGKLRVLKDAGIVSDRKDGRWVHYELVPDAFEEIETLVAGMKPRAVRGLSFDVALHLGTLIAVVAAYGRDWARLVGGTTGIPSWGRTLGRDLAAGTGGGT